MKIALSKMKEVKKKREIKVKVHQERFTGASCEIIHAELLIGCLALSKQGRYYNFTHL